jgi:predicted DNA-binding protein (UPF0251 family)
MSRPRGKRRIQGVPQAFFYKPQGIPLRQLEIVNITLEEFEALRLRDVKKLQQEQCAQEMHISQSTFQRIITQAHNKISYAIVHGIAIRIAQK